MKNIFTIFICTVSLLMAIKTSYAQDVSAEAEALTLENIDNFKASGAMDSLTIRKGAAMSKTMNFDDCHDPSYSLCIKLKGPCKKKVTIAGKEISLKLPSAGVNFKYWEPNAIVESVCNQGKSYYESDLNLASRMVGKKNILGKKATIAGLPAEKCIQTIKKGGGMEGAGASPRYFNEVNVWGIGIISRFYSSANVVEAVVSSICGYAGMIGGMFDSFSSAQGNSPTSMTKATSVESMLGIPDLNALKESSWMGDAFDTYTSVSEGFEGATGLDFTDTMKTAAAIGMGAMATMKKKSKKEVRPDQLCREKALLEESIIKDAEIVKITSDPDFNFGLFVEGYDDGGVCPIGVTNGYTLAYNNRSFRGVNEIQIPRNCRRSDDDCNDRRMPAVKVRVSQREIAGLYPSCTGYTVEGVTSAKKVYKLSAYKRTAAGILEDSSESVYSTEPATETDKKYYSDFRNRGSDLSPNKFSSEDTVYAPSTRGRYAGSIQGINTNIKDSDVQCSFDDSRDETCTTVLSSQTYNPVADHRKQLNDYMTKSMTDTFKETSLATLDTLKSINKRISDLGGDCDSSGKAAGKWGSAVMGAAYGIAIKEGLEYGLDYLKESPEYDKLVGTSVYYATRMKNKLVKSFSETSSDVGDYISDTTSPTIDYISDTASDVGDYISDTTSPAIDYISDATSGVTDTVSGWFSSDDGTEGGVISDATDWVSSGVKEIFPDFSSDSDSIAGSLGDIDAGDAMKYANEAKDFAKLATDKDALRVALIAMGTSKDPTMLWPAFTSATVKSWRGKNLSTISQIRGGIGTMGQLPCAAGSLAADTGLDDDGVLLVAAEDWVKCIGTWGPTEPQTGFVSHRDNKIAGALAGYRGYKLAVSMKSIKDQSPKAGAPMRMNLDFPHKSKCFTPGTADFRWESKGGLDPIQAIKNLRKDALDYASAPIDEAKDIFNSIGGSSDEKNDNYADDDSDDDYDDEDEDNGFGDSTDIVGEDVTGGAGLVNKEGGYSKEFKKISTDADGMVFTYWRKTKCCLYVVYYYGVGFGKCFEVDRKY